MALTLLIGGARSGKSSLAVDIGHRHHAAGIPVTYIATAPSVDADDDADMADRIERHRGERPAAWATIEEEIDLVGALSSVDERAGDRRLHHPLDLQPDVARTSATTRSVARTVATAAAAAPTSRADRGDHQRGRTRRPSREPSSDGDTETCWDGSTRRGPRSPTHRCCSSPDAPSDSTTPGTI